MGKDAYFTATPQKYCVLDRSELRKDDAADRKTLQWGSRCSDISTSGAKQIENPILHKQADMDSAATAFENPRPAPDPPSGLTALPSNHGAKLQKPQYTASFYYSDETAPQKGLSSLLSFGWARRS